MIRTIRKKYKMSKMINTVIKMERKISLQNLCKMKSKVNKNRPNNKTLMPRLSDKKYKK